MGVLGCGGGRSGKRLDGRAGFVGCGQDQFGSGAVGDAPGQAQGGGQTGVAVDERRDEKPKTARGGEGRSGPINDDGLAALGDDAIRDALQERGHASTRMPADDDGGGAEFGSRVEDAAGDAGVQPCEGNGMNARGFGARDGSGEKAFGFGDAGRVVGALGGNVQRIDGVGGAIGAKHEGEVDDGIGMGQGSEGHEDAAGIQAGRGRGAVFPFGQAPGGNFGDPGAEDAGGKNHQDGAVEDGVVEDADADADENGGEGCGGLVDAEAEEKAGFVARKAEDAAGEESGEPFGADDAGGHEGGDGPAVGTCEQGAEVDAHADGKKEKGDEESIADEVETAGQNAAARDDGAEGEAGEKGADDGLHAGEFGGVGKGKDDGENEYEFGGSVGSHAAEKPICDAREKESGAKDEGGQGDGKPDPERGVHGIAGGAANDDGQDEQRGRIGQYGAADCGGNGAIATDAEPLNEGEGDEGMGSEHAGQKDGFGPGKAQDPTGADGAEDLWDEKGQGSEDESRLPEASEIVEIDFEAGEKHQV